MIFVMMFCAIIATANLIWTATGKPVRPPIVAFAGFVCGFVWAVVCFMGAL